MTGICGSCGPAWPAMALACEEHGYMSRQDVRERFIVRLASAVGACHERAFREHCQVLAR
jgi:hypothetical protein